MHTTERLAAALKAAGAPADMVLRAIAGHYDDYKSPSATPIVDLVGDCVRHGLHAIAERARNGEFDATTEETEAWARSPEGVGAIQGLPPNLRKMFEKGGA